MKHDSSMPSGGLVALAAAVLLGLSACASLTVHTDFDREASFASLGRYDWADSTSIVEEPTEASPFLERRVRRAIDLTLGERGFVLDTAGSIDFIVAAFVVSPPGYEAPRHSPAVSFHFGVGIGLAYPYWYGYPPLAGYAYPYPFFGAFPYFGYPGAYSPVYSGGAAWTGFPFDDQPSNLPGTLIIDVFAAGSGELIWRGWADGALLDMPSGERAQDFLNKATAKILERFPPPHPG